MNDSPEFRRLLAEELGSELNSEQIERVVSFREEVLKENEVQNLTRLLSPRDFLDGHVLDSIHLKKSGFVSYPALDLGAGMGVPGFLTALIYGVSVSETWVSCDSEAMKTAFTQRALEHFQLENVTTTSQRAEDYLDTHAVDSVIARAVGPISRIYTWLERCSTWNKLVLLKGPKWEEEWTEFDRGTRKGKLTLAGEYRYEVGAEKKKRLIVRLERVLKK
jgi:16S rRNA (guanine(527)-N(7))-methyltransferase RsmG